MLFDGNGKQAINITGASRIANGISSGGSEYSHTIAHWGTGNLTIDGSSWITSGPYGLSTIGIMKPSNLYLKGTCRVYATNSAGKNCVMIDEGASGAKVYLYTTGYLYASAARVIHAYDTDQTASVHWKGTSGTCHLAANGKYMFYFKNKNYRETTNSSKTSDVPLNYINNRQREYKTILKDLWRVNYSY